MLYSEKHLKGLLDKKSLKDVLQFYEQLKESKKYFSKGYADKGQKNFRKALSEIKIDANKIDVSNQIIKAYNESREQEVPDETDDKKAQQDGFFLSAIKKRKEVYALYNKNKQGATSNNDPIEFAVNKAKNFLVQKIGEIFKKWDYTFDSTSGYFQLSESNNVKKEFRFKVYYWHENSALHIGYEQDYNLLEQPVEEEKHIEGERINEEDSLDGQTTRIGQVKIGELILAYDPSTILMFNHKNSSLILDVDNTIQMPSTNIKLEDGTLFLSFEDEQLKIQSHFVISIGRESPENWKILAGAYSTAGRRNKDLPIAGLVLLERLKSNEQRTNVRIPAEIFNYLYRSQLRGEKVINTTYKDLPGSRALKILERYVGQYKGIYFRKAKASENNRVEKFYFEIKDSGYALMIIPFPNNVLHKYEGKVTILTSKDDALVGVFDFLSSDKFYRFSISFNKEFKDGLLLGIYSGIERTNSFVPVAGRMIFEKLEGKIKPKNYKDYIKGYLVNDFINDSANNRYVTILSGRSKEEYIETLTNPNEEVDFFNSKRNNFDFAGCYYTYFSSTDSSKVLRIPLRIHSNGKVDMKTRDPESHELRSGIAQSGDSRLSIYMQNERGKNSFFHLLFSTCNINIKELEHCFGVSSKMDEFSRPSGRVEVLVKVNKDFNELTSEIFTVSSDSYMSEDLNTKGLLSYLTGKSNRYISARKTPNRSFKRNASYSYLYFNSACYLSSKGKYKKSLVDLYQAYLHGFGQDESDIKLLEDEIGTTFKNAVNLNIKESPDGTKLEPLSFPDLIKKIRKEV